MTSKQTVFDIILVQPRIPENVGFAARSMKAFGFKNLRLVSPAFKWDSLSPAYKTASEAKDILDDAPLFHSLNEAVSEFHSVVGFSRRLHQFERDHCDVIQWAEDLHERSAQRIALVFGSENFGLSNEDKHLCDTLVSIPLNEETMSLNLAHAVTTVLYELTRVPLKQKRSSQDDVIPATNDDQRRLMDSLSKLLDKTHFYKSGREELQAEAMRNLVQRLDLSRDEYHFAMGILKVLSKLDEETTAKDQAKK